MNHEGRMKEEEHPFPYTLAPLPYPLALMLSEITLRVGGGVAGGTRREWGSLRAAAENLVSITYPTIKHS